MGKTIKRKVELPLADSPINYYLRFTIPLGIAFLDEGFEDYFYSTHLQINAIRNGKYLNLYSQQIPSVKNYIKVIFSKKHMNSDKLLEHILMKLNDGYYIGIFLDWFYMPNRKSYGNQHFAHREYVYGYDLDTEELLVIGYSNKEIIEKSRMKFEDFKVAAYEARQRRTLCELTYYKHKKNVEYKFDFEATYKGLKSYYESKLTFGDRWRAQGCHMFLRERITLGAFDHGMNTHKYLVDLIQKEFDEEKDYKVSIKLSGFFEFKKCMLKRIIYMKNKGYLSDIDDLISEYSYVVKQYETFRNLYLKYSLTNNAEILFRIIFGIESLVDTEREIIGKLLERMEKVIYEKCIVG